MKKHRNKGKIIATAGVVCLFAVAWFWGGGYANRVSAPPAAPPLTATERPTAASGITMEPATNETSPPPAVNPPVAAPPTTPTTPEAAPDMAIDPETGKDKYLTDPVPEGKPRPVEPQDATIGDGEYTCMLTVRCDTILDNMDWLDVEKRELVPPDGVIFPETTVTFYEGESVFNVLQREMKRARIHMEFMNTPIYNSAYIEGINNLYEFDVGELSGWMYSVNGWFPNYGCSRYQLKDGDVVEWMYTCDLGADVGGEGALREQKPPEDSR